MQISKPIKGFILVALSVALFLGVLSISSGASVFAAADLYSNVLDDLQADKNFNAADYPTRQGSYALEIIQFAESDKGELFIYTYQPSGKFLASSVSIGKELGDDYTPKKYNLSYLNYSGTLYKYRVENFELSTDQERYYNVSQIWRRYIRQVDGNVKPDDSTTVNGQTIDEIGYKIGKYWKATTADDGNVSYETHETNVVEIVNPFASSVRYPNGTGWTSTKACDGHFIAFDVGNYDVTRLISAMVTYRTQTYEKTTISGTTWSELSDNQYRVVYHDEHASNTVNGLFGKQYNWDRISKTSDFVNDVNVEDETLKKNLLSRTWILNFLETDYTAPAGVDNGVALYFMFNPYAWGASLTYNAIDLLFSETSGTVVKEVAVLRMEFEVNGKVYNLGTVTDIVSGPENPAETKPNTAQEWWEKVLAELGKIPWWGWLLIFVCVVMLVLGIISIFVPVLRPIFTGLGKAILAVLRGLWWLLCLPFRGIAALVKRGRERRSNSTKSGNRRNKSKKKNRKGAKK